MRLALTLLLAAVVALLTGHLAVVSFFPSVIASHYPTVVSRVYDSKSGAANQEGAARLDAIDGRPGIMRVTLTKGAVERLALETVAVIEKPVQRTASIAGVVLASTAVPKSIAGDLQSSALVVRAPLAGAADKPAPGEPATIIPLAQGKPAARGGVTGQSARLIGIGSEDAASGAPPSAYYILSGENQELQTGNHVIVQIPCQNPAFVLLHHDQALGQITVVREQRSHLGLGLNPLRQGKAGFTGTAKGKPRQPQTQPQQGQWQFIELPMLVTLGEAGHGFGQLQSHSQQKITNDHGSDEAQIAPDGRGRDTQRRG